MNSFVNIDNLEIHFRQPGFFSGPFLQLNIGAMAGVLGAIFIIQTGNAQDIPFHWKVLAFILPFFAIVFIWRFFFMRRPVKPIIFSDDALLLPNGSESYSCKKVPYGNVLSFDVRERLGKQLLMVDTKSRGFAYPVKEFLEDHAVEVFSQNLRARILSLPDGEKRWQNLITRQRLAGIFSARKYPVTVLLLGIIFLVYIIQVFVGAEHNPFKLIELGANAPDLVKDGQWHRLITSNFLHTNLVHVAINGIALWYLGALLERMTGGLRFLLIFLVSGLLAALCSTLFNKLLFAVGASGAIFGLLGALTFINWRFRKELPGGYRIPLRTWLIIFGVNAALPLFIPQTDVFAHSGGLVGGALTAFILYMKLPLLAETPLYAKRVKALTAALGGVFLLGIAQAMTHYQDSDKSYIDRMNLVNALLQSPGENAGMLNGIAWWLAIEPSSTLDSLQTSRDLASKAVEIALHQNAQSGVVAAFHDTLATAHYRLGDFSNAVEIERVALDREVRAGFASQLARFLKARVEKDGPLISGNVTLSGIRLRKPGHLNESIVLDLDDPAVQGMDIYAHALDSDERILGLLRLSIAPNNERKNFVIPISPDVSKLLMEAKKLELALADGRDCRCPYNEWRFWPYDKSISKLP